jgi:hypothetical protein
MLLLPVFGFVVIVKFGKSLASKEFLSITGKIL